MLQETGLVIGLSGELAQVQTQNQLACASCKVQSSCGNGIVEKYLSGKVFVTQLNNTIDAQVGQQVIIEIPKKSLTRVSFVVYLIPLFFMFLGTFLATLYLLSENLTILIGLIGLSLGLLVTKYYNRNWLTNELYLPKMVKVVGANQSIKNNLNSKPIKTIEIN